MIETNSIFQPATAQAVQGALSAWNVVAVAVGVAVTHAYHTIVSGGGIKNIVRRLWDSEDKKS